MGKHKIISIRPPPSSSPLHSSLFREPYWHTRQIRHDHTNDTFVYELPPVWAPHVHRVFLEPRELQRLHKNNTNNMVKTHSFIRLSSGGPAQKLHTKFMVWEPPRHDYKFGPLGGRSSSSSSSSSRVVQATLRWMILWMAQMKNFGSLMILYILFFSFNTFFFWGMISSSGHW